jgi:serine/threonine protein phosphatase PrpC
VSAPRAEFAAFTDPGPVRERNEDRWLADPARGLFAVIDGMGGHAGGEAAAEIAKAALAEAPTPSDALMLANRRIHEAVQANPALAGMGCVATAVTAQGGALQVTHVGDTLALLVTRAGAEVLTARHTRAGALQAAHVLDDEEAAALGVSNQLLRDVGGQLQTDRAWFDVSEPLPVEPGDLLLLCTDGVHGPLSHPELVAALRDARAAYTPLDDLVRDLVGLALDRGGRDNATAVAIRWLPAEAITRPVAQGPASTPPPASPAGPPPGPPSSATPPPPATARTMGTLMVGVLLGVLLSAWALWSARSAAPEPTEPAPATAPTTDAPPATPTGAAAPDRPSPTPGEQAAPLVPPAPPGVGAASPAPPEPGGVTPTGAAPAQGPPFPAATDKAPPANTPAPSEASDAARDP